MKGNHPKWSFDEFKTFLLIHASMADLDFSEAERVNIKMTTSPEVFEAIEKEYNLLNDIERIETILAYREQYFKDEASKEKLISMMREQFNVDGKFDIMERNLLLALSRLL